MASALIPAELQTADFYLKSMSLFLKGSFGMIDRMEMYLSVLQNVLETGDALILKHLDIWRTDENGNPNYFDEDGPDADGTSDFYLDLIASIYGLRREVFLVAYDGVPAGYVTLTNYELLLYIQATAMKNRFDGTNKSLRKAYTGSEVFQFSKYYQVPDKTILDPNYKNSYLAGLNIIYRTQDLLEANVILQPVANEGEYAYGRKSGHVMQMFFSNLLTIESLGITYTLTSTDQFVGGKYGEENDDKAYYFGQNYDTEHLTEIYTYQ